MKISIITITYNSEKTLEETMKSVLSQNYDNIEYIIVDGMSTDGTLKIIDRYKSEKIKLISEKDDGISDAFNKGINIATGDIVGIINSDDILMSGALEKVSKSFEKNIDIDIVYGNCIRFTKTVYDGYEVKPCCKLEQMKYSFLLLHPSIFISKKAYEQYGLFKCEYKNAMDYELISRMYFQGAKFQYIDEVLSAFREGGVSQNKFGRTMEEHRKIAKINGGNYFQINAHVSKLYLRRYILAILKKAKLEAFLRRTMKHQKYEFNNTINR